MNPTDLNRTIAQATGESVATIQRLGFELLDPDGGPPQMIDWDEREDWDCLAELERATRSEPTTSLADWLSCFVLTSHSMDSFVPVLSSKEAGPIYE